LIISFDRRCSLAALLVCSCLLLISSEAWSIEAPPKQGLFVTTFEQPPVLASRKGIDDLVSFAARTGIRIIFMQVYRANQSWFPSTMADASPYEAGFKALGEDPLALLVRKAHAKGIEVHAWVNLMSLSKNGAAPLLKKYGPGILTRNIKDKKTLEDYKIDNQYFLEPGDLRVREDLASMVTELLKSHPDLDGIQFDYIRYPDKDPVYGYTPMNMARFRKATGEAEIEEGSLSWNNWKRAQVSELLERLVRRARAVRPGIQVSTTGCVSFSRAFNEAFQDWPSWINTGLVDFVTVMNYPETLKEFEKLSAEALGKAVDPKKVYMAVGAYKFLTAPEKFFEQFNACTSFVDRGCVIFYYGNLIKNPVLSEILIKK
jgi:uncharacterized lipoprotein YddW (UPF0748 family)